jgi:hypothetical protein
VAAKLSKQMKIPILKYLQSFKKIPAVNMAFEIAEPSIRGERGLFISDRGEIRDGLDDK